MHRAPMLSGGCLLTIAQHSCDCGAAELVRPTQEHCNYLWRKPMNTSPRYAVAAMAAVFVFGIASLALAQSPPRGTDSREVMIHDCWVKALQHYPYKGGDDSKD